MLNTNKPGSDENEYKVPENNNAEGQNGSFENLFLEECIISAALEKIQTICQANDIKADERHSQILNLIKLHENERDSLKNYIEITAECQKQTAAFANNQFEKNALHPAIETVDSLTRLIEQIHDQTTNLLEAQIQCPLFKAIISSIAQAVQVAQAKRQYLDIEHIKSEELDDFDPNKHEIKQAVVTNDNSKHKKIERTLVPGLIYRGKVLRQAKVSVYRYSA